MVRRSCYNKSRWRGRLLIRTNDRASKGGYARLPPFMVTEVPGDPLGGASGGKKWFVAQFIGKANQADFPFTVANEVVASFIGATLGLNVPPVFVHGRGEDSLVLVQMSDRDPRMQQGPPATSAAIAEYVAAHPDEVHGAVIFDLFVANNDRAFGPERRNLMLDGRERLLLYDHGNACYYRRRAGAGIEPGVPRLRAVAVNLRAMFDMDHKGNLYREMIDDWNLVEMWCQRIRQLPDYVIDAAMARIPDDLTRPTTEEREALRDFLLNRRGVLLRQIRANLALFPKLKPQRARNQ
jgi:hypothetical protein